MSYGSPLLQAAYRAAFPLSGSLTATTYGFLTRHRKYGSGFQQRIDQLKRTEREDTGALLERSMRKAVAFAERARATIPHYRERFAAQLGSRFSIRGPEDFLALPQATKSQVREAHESFRPPATHRPPEIVMHTSGTTGSALAVHISRAAYQAEYAFTWLHRAKVGLRRASRTATFAGHPVVPAERLHPPFWVENRADNQILFSSYHLSPGALPGYVERLRRFQPELIHGYPSSLAQIARTVIELGVTDIHPRGLFPASETLLHNQRSAMATAFRCPVLAWYGNTELVAHATECEAERIHIQHLHSLFEVLDEHGHPVGPGESGEIVGTNFLNDSMPLIRYRTGDTAIPAEGVCPCGRGGRLLESISGRLEDVIITPEGRRIGRLDHLFKDTIAIREAQIHQTRDGTVILRVVTMADRREDWEPILAAEARRRLGPSTPIRIEEVNSIPRGPNGKFRPVISDLSEHGKRQSI